MKEQEITLKEIKSFQLHHIFECGQCFRWNQQKDGSYLGVVRNNVLQISKIGNEIYIRSKGEEELSNLVHSYFDFDTEYERIKAKLSQIDRNMKTSIQYGEGIRILKQDLWEIIISFILSANNNIPRIKGIIERLSNTYGTKIEWKGQDYYTFPTIEQLSKAKIPELRKLGLGFRDKRVYQTTQIFAKGIITIEQLQHQTDTNQLREMLLTLEGVGPKVADCILLFGLHRFEVFPIDVWVRRVMNELYIHQEEEKKVTRKELEKLASTKYENLAGVAQQYLFYWKRENAS